MTISITEIWASLGWGAVASSGLVAGMIAGGFARLSHRGIALTMSVGAGLLLAAASVELTAEVIRIAGPTVAVTSLLFGAVVISAANAVLARFGAANRKRCGECAPQASESEQPGSGVAIALGTALDAVPEAMVLGLALHERAVPVGLLIAICIGNFPEALSGSAGMRLAGRSRRYILLLWSTMALGVAVATAAGFVAFASVNRSWAPPLQAFGAGALLAMTAETMIPEGFHNGPRFSGFLAAVGFCVVLLIGATAP